MSKSCDPNKNGWSRNREKGGGGSRLPYSLHASLPPYSHPPRAPATGLALLIIAWRSGMSGEAWRRPYPQYRGPCLIISRYVVLEEGPAMSGRHYWDTTLQARGRGVGGGISSMPHSVY